MSSDNAQSAVTYTSISSDSDGPSWGIPLMNAGEFPEMDPYEEVAQQGQEHPLSPTYIPDPIELDEHAPVYAPEPQHPEYHAPSDDDIQVEDDNDDPDEDPEEDPNEEHESKGSDETEPFKEDKIAITPPPPRHRRRAAMIHRKDDILEEDMPPRRRFALTGSPPGAADRAKDASYVRALQASERRMMTSIEEVNLRVSYQAQVRRQETENLYTQLLDAQTDRRDIRLEIDVVRGQRTAYETELQEVHQAYLSSKARNRELLARLEMLETHMSHMEWQRQSVEDLAVTQMMRIHTLEARARADTVEDVDSGCYLYFSFLAILYSLLSVMGNSHLIDFRTIMPVTRQRTNDAMTPESIQAMIDRAIQRNSTHTQDDASQSLGEGLRRPVQPARAALTWWNGHVRTLGHDAAYAMTWRTLKKKLMDKYCPKGEIKKLEIELWNLRVKGNDVAAYTQRFQELALIPKTLDETIELANDLMDQKLRTYAERQNENKRKANDSPRNNQKQPHKKQNVSRGYTAGPDEKKVYTGDLPLRTKCNYHHTRQCAPKCGKCK
nr:hypothetical protein [Tanacetum cinerariifolium]